MGIYIPGMEIPKEGYLIVRIYANGEVYEPTNCAYILNKVATAVPIPPHGRLIDADAFEKKNAYFWNRDFINPKYSETLADLVNVAPTIIPAEEDE